MQSYVTCFNFFLLAIISFSLDGQNEADVIQRIAKHWECESEFDLKNGRVDILTKTHAYEVERASNWKESIGQALWYSLMTNKRAGIILIVVEAEDYNYGRMLNSALLHGNLHDQIEVIFYPEDIFPNEKPRPVKTADGRYWISSSGTRHNARCHHYKNTEEGHFGSTEEGKACKLCGG